MKQAAVALIERNGLFLSVSRKYDTSMLGLPGGAVENESIEEAMVRELFEETGLKAIAYQEFYKDNDGYDFETTCFLVTQCDGEAYSKEAGVVEWVEKEKLCTGPFGWYNKKVFEHLDSGLYHKSCQSHCCKGHGCKFNYNNCPVTLGNVIQDNPCENCENDDFINADFESNIVYLSPKTMDLMIKYNNIIEDGTMPLDNKDQIISTALEHLFEFLE